MDSANVVMDEVEHPPKPVVAGEYVQSVLQYLTEKSPGFLNELRSIELPPINFKQCLDIARTHVNDIPRLLSSTAEANSAIQLTEKKAEVTFSFLMMQLHVRGSKSFWMEVDKTALFCFVSFATVDLMVDALSHLPNNETTGFNTVPLIAAICSFDFLKVLEVGYDAIHPVITQQHTSQEDNTWQPSERDVNSVLVTFNEAVKRQEASNNSWSMSQKLLLTVGVGAISYLLYRRFVHK
jgi:hypothetical protein